MKKIFIMLLAFVILAPASYATTTKTEGVYYKTISITNTEIEQNFGTRGEKVVDYLESTFLKLRADKDRKKLEAIDARVAPILLSLQNKPRLTRDEENLKLLAENIYARTNVLKDYLLK